LSGLTSAFILFSTVFFAVCFGISAAYGIVIGILRTFASQSSRPAGPALAQSQTRAAHAGGD